MQYACTTCGLPSDRRQCARHRSQRRQERKAAGFTGERGSTRAWRRLRDRVLERDDHTCVRCGVTKAELDRRDPPEVLDVHHLIGKAAGGSDVMANLVSLCPRCHGSVS